MKLLIKLSKILVVLLIYNNSNNKNSQKEELEKIKIIQNNDLKSESKNINQCKEDKVKKEIERKIEIKKLIFLK